ncbi:MAG: hypothetical protein GWP19_00520 [Planctomycetia bacterium]|nr:hypothetical protein [Planctomycetia bacterium]
MQFTINPFTKRLDAFEQDENPAGDIEYLVGDTGGNVGPTGHAVTLAGGIGCKTTGTPGSSLITIDVLGGGGITHYIVDAVAGASDYQTIQSAINAANSAGGGSVYVRYSSSAYTEDLTLYDKVRVLGVDAASFGENLVIINGKHTPPLSGSFVFENVCLRSATHIFDSAGAGSTDLTCRECTFDLTNGYIFYVPSWTGVLEIHSSDDTSTASGILNNTTGTATLFTTNSNNLGSANASISAGSMVVRDSFIDAGMAFTGSGTVRVYNTRFDDTLEIDGTTTGDVFDGFMQTGANPAFTITTSGRFNIHSATIASTAVPVIAGTQSLYLGDIDFVTNKGIASTLTILPIAKTDRDTPFIVGGKCLFATIQEALDLANKDGSNLVKVMEGTFNENLTLYGEVFIEGAGKNTVINGTHVLPATGQLMFSNCVLQSDASIFSSANAYDTSIKLHNLDIKITVGNTGTLFNLPNWTGGVMQVQDCLDFSAGNLIVYNLGTSTALYMTNSELGTIGQSSSGTPVLDLLNASLNNNISQTGGAIDCNMSTINGSLTLTSCNAEIDRSTLLGVISIAGTTNVDLTGSEIDNDPNEAIIHNSSGVVTINDNFFNTSSADPLLLTGAGSYVVGTNFFPSKVGINTIKPDKAQEINSTTGDCLRLTHNDANGSAANYSDLTVSSAGDLTIAPSAKNVTVPVIVPMNNQTGITYTLTATDCNKTINLSNAAAITLTLPEDATEALVDAFQCTIVQAGVGQVTIVKENTDTISSADSLVKTRTQNSAVTIINRGNYNADGRNNWYLSGDLTA